MTNTYRIAEDNRENVAKKINRLLKKANQYGFELEVDFGETYVAEIPVIDEEEGTRYTEYYEVFDLTITSEGRIKKGDYEVLAKLDHTDEGNVVTLIDADECKPEWTTIKPFCKHCNSNHNLKYTYIVKGAEGEKQIGKTCLKDYCGIDPQSVGIWNELNAVATSEDVEHEQRDINVHSHMVRTVEALAHAIEVMAEQGYVKSEENGCNKVKLAERIAKKVKPSEESMKKAEEIEKAILDISLEEACRAMLNTVQTLLKNKFSKLDYLGYIAYAPLAYERYAKKVAERKAREQSDKNSQYIGNIGEKVSIAVTECKLCTSWENQWGYTYLYKITDTQGNVFIWYASSCITHEVSKITGTVKQHSERDGVKQTIITRCKAVA